MDTLLELLTYIRVELLEKVYIPGLGISYWHFLIYLAVASVVVTVLVNGVRLGHRSGDSKEEKPQPKEFNRDPDRMVSINAGKPKPNWMK